MSRLAFSRVDRDRLRGAARIIEYEAEVIRSSCVGPRGAWPQDGSPEARIKAAFDRYTAFAKDLRGMAARRIT